VASAQDGPLRAARASATAPRPASFSPAVERFISARAPVVAITDVVLVDGTGAPARTGMTVLVEGDRIAAVGPGSSVPIPPEAELVNGAGRTLTPGWVMLHEHMFYPSGSARYNTNEISFPPLYLGGGATTIRTGGSMEAYTDLRLRNQVNAGLVAGPRMDVTGPYLEGPGGFVRGLPELRTPEEARAHVAFWADRGVTSFKAYNLIDRATLGAAIEAAHERGIKVTAHLCSITYREAADLGIDDLEHGFRVATDWVEGKEPDRCPPGAARAESYAALDLESPAFLDLVDHLVAKGVAITATPPVFERGSTGRPLPPQGALDAILPQLRERVVERYTRARDTPDPEAQALFAKMQRALRVFVERGGHLVLGIDPTGGGDVVAGYGNQRAVQLLVEAGFGIEEAVRIATLEGARYLEAADVIGSVEVGKRADLVLLEGDLRTDLDALRRPVLVFKDGIGFDAPALLRSAEGTVGLR
ncbi:MAG TPA: amidohydrolase family protein, partial [Longimicrobiales bacterium]|nr:amidohydrolase family protein [Longimicrobiales bacterium]